jgi:DNA polymerase-1
MTQKRLLVIDLMNLAFRVYHGLGRTQRLQTIDGRLTFVCYGVAGAFKKLIDKFSPDYIVIARDSKGPGLRHEMYPAYKANRKPSDSDFGTQITDLMEMIRLFGFPAIVVEKAEADDVIGTIATKYANEEVQVCIVSGDKDFMQLLGNSNVRMMLPKQGDYIEGGAELAVEKFGVQPGQVVDVLAIMGDAVDNVPGVRGIGEVGAGKLIRAFGSLEGTLENMHGLAPKMFEKLAKSRSSAEISKKLVQIKCDLDFELDFNACQVRPNLFEQPELVTFFEKMEFHSLLRAVDHYVAPEDAHLNNLADISDEEVPF